MTPEQFAYWLQGFAELNPQAPNAEQWQAIRDHLGAVFHKVTPRRVEGPNIASPALPLREMEEALRRAAEQVRRDTTAAPNFPSPYWDGMPRITC